jgi:TRAP-type mannitol/chloroaromatic compound transport system permease large subunit
MIMLVLTGGTMYTGVFLGMGGGVVTEQILMGLNLTPCMMVFLFLGVAFIAGFLLGWISVP